MREPPPPERVAVCFFLWRTSQKRPAGKKKTADDLLSLGSIFGWCGWHGSWLPSFCCVCVCCVCVLCVVVCASVCACVRWWRYASVFFTLWINLWAQGKHLEDVSARSQERERERGWGSPATVAMPLGARQKVGRAAFTIRPSQNRAGGQNHMPLIKRPTATLRARAGSTQLT